MFYIKEIAGTQIRILTGNFVSPYVTERYLARIFGHYSSIKNEDSLLTGDLTCLKKVVISNQITGCSFFFFEFSRLSIFYEAPCG